MVSKRHTNYFYCFFAVFNFLFFGNVGWFHSTRAFHRSTIFIECSLKSLWACNVTNKLFLNYDKDLWVYICFVYIYIYYIYFLFYQDVLHRHWTVGEGRGPSFIPLYHFHPLTNTETFIRNFASEMTITYFSSRRLCLPDCYSMRFTTLSN